MSLVNYFASYTLPVICIRKKTWDCRVWVHVFLFMVMLLEMFLPENYTESIVNLYVYVGMPFI